ncbi:unnamed protein product [Rotaria magnacalcarata]|uniref:Rap-GAP domain-containing protein n=1 Tax=Rotaria magnacalcarata TaxID=392030 RepID=A0A816CVH7_9BILA|nr:unnamed protein product [Rotaria magnacalcarata]CAF1929893.1 unnamed protein product [Rotaria magnacalcarata]
MQTSHQIHSGYHEDNVYKHYKHVKHIENHNMNDQRNYVENHSSYDNSRSMSSTFRHSIRHLTSCASARRKPGRNSVLNKNGSANTETKLTLEDEHRYSSKKSSSSYNQHNHHAGPTVQSANQDLPPALPPRKPMDKNNSVQMSSATRNPSVADNVSLQISSSTVDDISSSSSLAPPRVLTNKEISTSLANLMGTASDSISVNNVTKPITRHNQRISAAPATTVDRLGLLESLASTGSNGMVESPSSHRTVFIGNHTTMAYNKPSSEYTWCSERSNSMNANSGTSFDECLPQLEIDDKPMVYREQFETNEHFNWYGISESHGPVIISYKHSINQNKQRSIMSIVRTRQGTSIESISDMHSSCTPFEILRRLCEQCSITDIEYFDPVLCDGTHDLLIKYDESHVSNQHKFGIIYQCEDQLTEEDIFSNETHSPAMDKFLDLIGTRVKLKDFRGFRGGLDVKSDHTGTESVYEQFLNHEIMFHVSTLLPHSKSERQQLERKRHIGNDIVAIVFQETETIFNPECIASQFLHVYLVITPLDSDGTHFKVSVIHRDSVPLFGPNFNYSTSFQCDHIFKQWLLTKLINAEIASCRASTFQKYQARTKMNLFENLYRTLHDNNRSLMNFILCNSQYKHECDIEQQQKEEANNNNNNNSSSKSSDRHTESSLLGSVRRRFIAPKLRVQNSTTTDNGKSSPASNSTITTPSSNNINDSRSKTRSMTMDLRRSTSRESITTNGNNMTKVTSFFSSSKTNSPRLDKAATNRSLLDQDNMDSASSSRSNTKFLSPATCPSSPWTTGPTNGLLSSPSNEWNPNGDSYLQAISVSNTPFHYNNKLSSDDIDNDIQLQLLPDDLQSSSKDDLIKFVIALQQQHSLKISQMDQSHSNALKHLEMQLSQPKSLIQRDSP